MRRATRENILAELRKSGVPMQTAQIAYSLKCGTSNVSSALIRLERFGAVVRYKRGVWGVPKVPDRKVILSAIEKIEIQLAEIKKQVLA